MVGEGLWAIAELLSHGEEDEGLRAGMSPRVRESCLVLSWLPVIYLIGCDALMREHLMGRWEGPVTTHAQQIVGCGRWHSSDREHQEFIEVFPEAHPLQGVRVLIEEVIKALCTQQWWEHLATVTDQCMCGKGAFEVKVNLPIFKDKKMKDAVILLLMAVGCGYFSSVRLRWSMFAAVHFLLNCKDSWVTWLRV